MPFTEIHPFGVSDATRADPHAIQDGFVRFDNEALWGGLATRKVDRSARIIVGRKGSGKTLYLRRLQIAASADPSLYTDEIRREGLTTESVIAFCQMFQENVLTEKWIQLWRKAILLSACSHILCAPKLKDVVPAELAEQLRDNYKPIVPKFITPVSAYNQVTRIIESHDTTNKLRAYFNHELWEQLEWTLSEHINNLPPLCFYLDAVDDEFENAPMYWLRCQKGLFHATIRLLRDDKFGSRLLIFIGIRDLVLSSALQSEHSVRYLSEPHIRILTWNRDAIRHLLKRKIEALDEEFFLESTTNGKSLAAWLGRENIVNFARKVEEPLEQYLLRHTRFLPRDIIILGNHLCAVVQRAKNTLNTIHFDEMIRRAVSETARELGNEQLTICSKQLVADQIPEDAGRYQFADSYISVKEYARGVSDDLVTLIASIGKDRFKLDDLVNATHLAKSLFGERSDAFSVLWQNGLLGYVEKRGGKSKPVFYSEDRMNDFRLPYDKKEYVFHSCLIDSVSIRAIGKHPVF